MVRTTKVLWPALAALLAGYSAARAQMVTGKDIPGFAETLGVAADRAAQTWAMEELAIRAGDKDSVNVLWPGESATLTLLITNKSSERLLAHGRIEVIQYGTRGRPGDFWTPDMFAIRHCGDESIDVDVPGNGQRTITALPAIPETLGGYALVAELEGHGRTFVASLVRAIGPDAGKVQFPTYALDTTWPEFMNDHVLMLFRKLGIKGARMGASYVHGDDPESKRRTAELDTYLRWAAENDVTAMLTIDNGTGPMPLGRPRPWLSDDGRMLDTKDDRAWLPACDDDFEGWVARTVAQYGWPRGPVNAVELWNEPWESISISGWGADIPRYRDIYEHMAKGVERARKEAGVKVLIGGACSSTNTRDKLFPDGSDKFLKWLDFVSIHYQPMSADPALVPEWVHRGGPYGRVRVWDTESWIANSEDRVAVVIASMRAQGQDRTAGVFEGNVYQSANRNFGGRTWPVVQAWSPAAAIAATQKFIGQRNFRELLFRNGLPWVFVFDGLKSADDGTLVVTGDLGGVYSRSRVLFRSVRLGPNATMVIDRRGPFALYDFYGNRVESSDGRIVVPLNGLGYFLRPSGEPGSFRALIDAVRIARITGYDPVEIVAHDFTSRVEDGASLHLTLTNVLNRPVSGFLNSRAEGLTVQPAALRMELAANETRELTLHVQGGTSAANVYPVTVEFRSDADGATVHREDLHANVIAHRSIHVDGHLEDWSGVPPQTIASEGIGPSLTQEAWLPFRDFGKSVKSGLATAWLGWDERYFYFAAKVVDVTPDEGMVRFEHRDDDSYFYPDIALDADKQLRWPEGVRHFSYRRNFDIPSGNDHDNIQIAFNVLPEKDKPLYSSPPGTMRHFMVYADTDYEFALNPVAEKYGGGTEVWRLLAPGMPRKHFFPRQPASPRDGGPVQEARLAIRREGDLRIVEAAIPWSEIPRVHDCLEQGRTVRFTYRVNDNKGPALELAAGRSVSKENALTFHDDWSTHWANELEFAFEK